MSHKSLNDLIVDKSFVMNGNHVQAGSHDPKVHAAAIAMCKGEASFSDRAMGMAPSITQAIGAGSLAFMATGDAVVSGIGAMCGFTASALNAKGPRGRS